MGKEKTPIKLHHLIEGNIIPDEEIKELIPLGRPVIRRAFRDYDGRSIDWFANLGLKGQRTGIPDDANAYGILDRGESEWDHDGTICYWQRIQYYKVRRLKE